MCRRPGSPIVLLHSDIDSCISTIIPPEDFQDDNQQEFLQPSSPGEPSNLDEVTQIEEIPHDKIMAGWDEILQIAEHKRDHYIKPEIV